MKNNRNSFTTHISLILAALAFFGIFVYSPIASGASYGDYTFSVLDGEVTIMGYSGSGDVVIPSEINGYPVSAIGEKAFRRNKELTSVIIPDSVLTIGKAAFDSCSSLKKVTLGKSLIKIGAEAFSLCESLREVIIPDKVEIIENMAFADCYTLEAVKLGKKTSSIGVFAFFCCYKLNGISVDEENESFVSIDGVLYNKDVTEIVWCPNSKTEFTIPESVTVIGDSAFSCSCINNLSIPGNVIEIGESAYAGCASMTNLIIPDRVKKVGQTAFAYITTLKNVTFGSGLKIIPLGLFNNCVSLTIISIPEGVEEIGAKAFINCTSLKTVTIPASVTKMGEKIFQGCDSLSDIYFGGTRSEWSTISQVANVPSQTVIHFGENTPPIVNPPDVDEPSVLFTDVKANAFYAEAVMWAVENSITSGTSKTTFSPENGCTRGQVVTFLWRATGSPEPESKNILFSDIKEGDYYYKAILWATENNITKGTSATMFSPSDVCTRAQIVTFLWRAAGCPEPETKNNPFCDVKEDNFFYKAVLWAVENGITKGTTERSFSPNEVCTRGQIVTFIYRNKK